MHKKKVLKVIDDSKALSTSLLDERIAEMKTHEDNLKAFIKKQQSAHDLQIKGMKKLKKSFANIYSELQVLTLVEEPEPC